MWLLLITNVYMVCYKPVMHDMADYIRTYPRGQSNRTQWRCQSQGLEGVCEGEVWQWDHWPRCSGFYRRLPLPLAEAYASPGDFSQPATPPPHYACTQGKSTHTHVSYLCKQSSGTTSSLNSVYLIWNLRQLRCTDRGDLRCEQSIVMPSDLPVVLPGGQVRAHGVLALLPQYLLNERRIRHMDCKDGTEARLPHGAIPLQPLHLGHDTPV